MHVHMENSGIVVLQKTEPVMRVANLAEQIDRLTAPGELYEKLEGDKVRCFACAHRCLIRDGQRGICQVRFNHAGVLYVPYGYTVGLNPDPIEKKPLYHVLPGATALTFGMLGCDFHCPFCQNWLTTQALRDEAAGVPPRPITAEQVIDLALQSGSRAVISSYNEPLITAEWAAAIFKLAKQAGLLTGFVSNGHATPEVLDYLRPVTDCYKVDLKSMRQENYRRMGGQLRHVLATIEGLHQRGYWVEVVTLVIPGFNDSDAELRETADFIASVSPDIPWHVTAFHRDYKMRDAENTPPRTLLRAAEIGVQAGLHFVYVGNIPGHLPQWETTWCPQCHTALVVRYGYWIESYNITPDGRCPKCQTAIPGRWWTHEQRR
jgi:pyruvate formate lyase activating enzyme